MRFKILGRKLRVRLFEPVLTVDEQYNLYDVGLEQEDGSIDSLAVGGSFSLVKSICRSADERADAEPSDAEPVAS